MLCKCGLCRHALSVCPSVRLSVTIVNSVSVKMSNRKLRFFSRSGGFSVPNVMAILRRDPPPNWGIETFECRWNSQKSRFWENIRLHRVLSTLRPTGCYQHGAAGRWKVVTLIVGIKGTHRRRLTCIFSRSIKNSIYHIFTYKVWTPYFYLKGIEI